MTYEPKNIVVCLDGTGNQVEQNISNVLKFYRALDRGLHSTVRQVVFYDQGVGTVGHRSTWGAWRQSAGEVWGLTTGAGLDINVLKGYAFIAEHYHEESEAGVDGKPITIRDRIYIFGYSRGAHTARVLAAFLYNIGLLRREQMHLAGAAFTAYKRTKMRKPDDEVEHFQRTLQPRIVATEFMGVWDTVSSMIVPGGKRILPKAESLRNTRNNPGVKAFRHAMSIDEARYMFRLDLWNANQVFKPNRHSQEKEPERQDCLQVWFPGYHGDVGGGNDRVTSGLSQFPLCWMIQEAASKGLKFRTQNVNDVALGEPRNTATYHYPKPNHMAPAHSSKGTAWTVLEFLPKFAGYRESITDGNRKSFAGFYIPRWEPRTIPEDSYIHEAAILKEKNDSSYNPKNLPTTYQKVTHPTGKYQNWPV